MYDKNKFPIGLFQPIEFPDIDRGNYIQEIKKLVPELKLLVSKLNNEQLNTSYSPGGRTVKQVVHHMADNDMNAYLRLKRALTEHEPTASSYDQDKWAALNDYVETSIEISIGIMELLHVRLINLLVALHERDYRRRLKTNALGTITIDAAIQRFIWHNKHHIAQIKR